MSNIEIYCISNTYGEPNKIKIADVTIRNMSKIKIRQHHFKNLSKETLTQSLIMAKKCLHTNTALLFINGHGRYDFDNQKEVFKANDHEYIYIDEIIAHFSCFENIIVFIDTCQSSLQPYHASINKTNKFSSSNTILCCSVPKGKIAFGTLKGMCFTSTICRALEDNINPKEDVEINALVRYIHIAYREYQRKYRMVPNIYTNNYAINDTLNIFSYVSGQKKFLLHDREYYDTSGYDEEEQKLITLHIEMEDYHDKKARRELELYYDHHKKHSYNKKLIV